MLVEQLVLITIKEAKRLTSTPELRRSVQSAENPPGGDLDEATGEFFVVCICFKAFATIAVTVASLIIFMTT